MSDLRKKFGRRLRQLRREREMTQEYLAETAGVSVDMLSNMERGINAPSFETLERLTRALGISIHELFILPE